MSSIRYQVSSIKIFDADFKKSRLLDTTNYLIINLHL